MLRILLILVQTYGFDVAQIGLIIYLFWKLFYNHLKHLTEDIKNNGKSMIKLHKDICKLSNRVSKIEGKIKL